MGRNMEPLGNYRSRFMLLVITYLSIVFCLDEVSSFYIILNHYKYRLKPVIQYHKGYLVSSAGKKLDRVDFQHHYSKNNVEEETETNVDDYNNWDETKMNVGRYEKVLSGLDLLYPPEDLSKRTSISRSDGYWTYLVSQNLTIVVVSVHYVLFLKKSIVALHAGRW